MRQSNFTSQSILTGCSDNFLAGCPLQKNEKEGLTKLENGVKKYDRFVQSGGL